MKTTPDLAPFRYAAAVTAFGLFYITALTFVPIPAANADIVRTLLGFVLGTLLTTAVNYVLGSSKSSSDKTKLLTNQKEEEPK